MCNPQLAVMGIMALTSAATTAMSIMDQNEYADQMKEQAMDAYEIDMDALDDKAKQINDKGDLDVLERQRQAKREAAKARVSAAEGGVFGNSQIMEAANVIMQEGYDTSIIKKNVSNQQKQLKRERKRVKAGLSARNMEAESMATSGWASGLQIGTAAANGAAQGYSMGGAFAGPSAPGATGVGSQGGYTPNRAGRAYTRTYN